MSGLLIGSGGVLRHADPAAAQGVLDAVLTDYAGGWRLPERARVIVDRQYLLAPIGLLEMTGRPRGGTRPGRGAGPRLTDGISRRCLTEGTTGSGADPWATSAALARLNGREPKNPRSADIGLGWAETIRGVSPSIGARPCASRPHRIATSGPPRATSARIGGLGDLLPALAPVRSGVARGHGEHPVEQQDALVGPRGQVAGRRAAGSRGRRAARGRCWPGCAGRVARRGPRRTRGRPRGPGVGYGSCPTISTRTSAMGRVNARSTFDPAGR